MKPTKLSRIYDADARCENEKRDHDPFLIHTSKGITMELKLFRDNFYVELSQHASGSSEFKMKYNVTLDMLQSLDKASKYKINHDKKRVKLIYVFA